jgi:hypothetical protein
MLLALSASFGAAQPTPPSKSICEMPEYRGTAAYNYHCVSHAPSRSPSQRIAPAPRPPVSQPPGPNLVLKNGKWSPEDGYVYVSRDDDDYRVRWASGRQSKEHPHSVASEEEETWHPADGYKWLNDVTGDYRVVWVPGTHPKDSPHVLAGPHAGRWEPEDGYIWRSEPRHDTDFRVVEDHRVADALRLASVVVRWPEQLNHIEEFYGFKKYNYNRVSAALHILASGWVVDMPAAADRRQREILVDHAAKELRGALKAALMSALEQITDDMRKLRPYKWNLFRAQQSELIGRLLNETETLHGSADDQIDSDTSFTIIRSGSQRSALQYSAGPALVRLAEINRERRWAD